MEETTLYIGRQPILDRQGRIFGYELLARQSDLNYAVISNGALSTSQVLGSVFSVFGSQEVFGEKRAFVNLSDDLLEDSTIELFHPGKLVLEILETMEPTGKLVEQCKDLKAKDYLLAVDDFTYSREWEPILYLADFVKLDYQALGRQGIARQAQYVRRPHLKLVAEKVETEEEFEICKALGFDYFQGYYFAHPTMLRARDVPASQMLLIHLMNRTIACAELGEIEEIFKRDVGLSYKLLCYVNSAGMGLRYKVTSVRHALTMIGHQQLYRWLTLMLALSGQGSYPALTSIAITRGRLMELLGFRSGLVDQKDQEVANRMFITGMFSLLDALLSVPMPTILQRLKLDPTVEEALADHTGPYGAYLDLIDASERNDMEKMGALGDRLHLDTSMVCKSIFEAMAWTENVAV